MQRDQDPQRIAVIGSGIAGLASAWLLAQHHPRRPQVTLIERNDYIGGHTHTIPVDEDGRSVPVDTGFIVYNEPNYPLLTRLFQRLGVATRSSDMSFAASIADANDNTGAGTGGEPRIEYAGDNLNTVFAQRRNLFNPGYLRMLVDLLRFNRQSRARLAGGGFDGLSLGAYLERLGTGSAFREHYLLPMAAAIWSCPTRTMLDFPAESMARFFANHGLLSVIQRPLWRSVVGGSSAYIAPLLAGIGADRIVNDGACRVTRTDQGVEVGLQSGGSRRFDAVVLACHADEALALLAAPTADEQRLLGRFRYQPNETWLHTDTRLMPRLRRVWSSWNYLSRIGADGQRAVSVTYWMNRLQGLKTRQDYLVSLNPLTPPAPEQVIARMTYHHPVFDQPAMDAQRELHRLQGQDGLWYCGSYFGYGFHEDALRSAVDLAGRLGADTGWLTATDDRAAAVPGSASVNASPPAATDRITGQPA